MRFIILLLLVYSCQIDHSFQDLTPDNDFNSTFYFNSPEFTKAIANVGRAESDTTFNIDRPENLLPPPLLVVEEGWKTTDTFAFETADFQKVLNVIAQTAEMQKDSIQSALVSSEMAEISLNGQSAYSLPGKYYLVPFEISSGEHIFIQITRTKSTGNSYWSTYYYTANGLWMIGRDKKVRPDKDVS